jgi:hypothetical protein
MGQQWYLTLSSDCEELILCSGFNNVNPLAETLDKKQKAIGIST